MARDPRYRLEDWMRLILLNWVLISFIMFYSILMGLAVGCLIVFSATAVIGWVGLPAEFLRLYPSPGPTAILVMGGLIAAFFLHLFRHLHYNCDSGNYTLAVSRILNFKVFTRFAIIVLLLIGVGAGISWLSAS